MHDIWLSVIKLGPTEEMQETLAEEFFVIVLQDNQNQETTRLAEELLDIVPYYWTSMKFLCDILQTDGFITKEKQLKFSTPELLKRMQDKFPRQGLTYVMEGICLSEVEQDNAVNILRGNLAKANYPLGWFTLATLYAERNSSLVFDTVKRGMASIVSACETYPSFKMDW